MLAPRRRPTPRWPAAVAPRSARARRDAAVLAAAPPAARGRGRHARDDERQRLRRADRLPRRRRAASGWRGSPTCSCSTTARSTRAPTTRSCARERGARRRPLMLRRSRGYVPASLRAPACRPRAPAGLRRRAEEHLLRGQGRARLGRPPHRRPRELRDAALLHRGHRALRAPVRGGAGGRGPRPAPRVPLDQVRARARRRAAGRRPAPPRAPGGLPGRARRERPGGRGDLRRHRLRQRRHRLGRRAADRGPRRVRARGPPAAGADARRRGGDPRAVADGVRVAAPPRTTLRRSARRRSPMPSTPMRWRAVAALRADGLASPLTSSMGGCSTPSRRSAASAREVNYEGQAAIELEAAATRRARPPTRCR